MTWTKLPDDYPDSMDTLSDAAFRCHTEAMQLVLRRERGPVVPLLVLLRYMNSPHAETAMQELLDCGYWTPVGADAVRIVHCMEHQPEPDVLAARRANNAERQRRHRRRAAGLDSDPDNPVTP